MDARLRPLHDGLHEPYPGTLRPDPR
jgi:hypothetical protein